MSEKKWRCPSEKEKKKHHKKECTYKCGKKYFKWQDKCGNNYRTLLVSATDPAKLNETLAKFAQALQTLYNSGAPINPSTLLATGFVDASSTIVLASPLPPYIPQVTTLVGGVAIATALAELFSTLRAVYIGSTIAVTSTGVVLTNGLVSTTTTIVLTTTSGKFTFTAVTLARDESCGSKVPPIVSGTLTVVPPPPPSSS